LLNKLIPLLAFSVLLLVPVGAQKAFAGPPTVISSDITQASDLVFAGPVEIDGDITITITAGDLEFQGPVVLEGNLVVNAQDVTFGSTVDSDFTSRNLAVNTFFGGTTTFAGAVGGLSPLASLTTDAGGFTKLGGDVFTILSQTYNDPVILENSLTLDSSSSSVFFHSTVTVPAGFSITITSPLGNQVRILTGELEIEPGAEATLNGGGRFFANFDNDGTLSFAASLQQAGGDMENDGTVNIATHYVCKDCVFDNFNVINIEDGGVLDNEDGTPFNNFGTINIKSGGIFSQEDAPFNNDGIINIEDGGKITIFGNDPAIDNADGVINIICSGLIQGKQPNPEGTINLIPCPIGGEIIPIKQTSLILAGAQTFSWMIPVVLSVLGIGLFVVSRKSENF